MCDIGKPIRVMEVVPEEVGAPTQPVPVEPKKVEPVPVEADA